MGESSELQGPSSRATLDFALAHSAGRELAEIGHLGNVPIGFLLCRMIFRIEERIVAETSRLGKC